MFARLATTLAVDRRRLRRLTSTPDNAPARALPVLREQAAAPAREDASRVAGPDELDRLDRMLENVSPHRHPRTAKLLGSGRRKVAQKVIEEAGEVALEAVKHDLDGVVRESADLLYHLVVLWRRNGIAPAEIWTEMRLRADQLGIAEKLPKAAHHKVATQTRGR